MATPLFFRHTEDRVPVSIIVGLFAADCLVYCFIDNTGVLLAWLTLMVLPKACICSWNHHHQHVPTFRPVMLNRLLEVVYAFHTGITTNAWVLHHVLGHHLNYTNQKKDESRWARADGSKMGVIEYTLSVAITGYWRAYQVGRNYPRYQRQFLSCTTIVIALLAALTWYQPKQTIIVFLLPMLWGYLATCWHTFYHHAGLNTQNEFEASYNILNRAYNLCTGNLGYHTAHHIKPGLHWSKLPGFHAEIEDKIPSHLYRSPCIPFNWIGPSGASLQSGVSTQVLRKAQ